MSIGLIEMSYKSSFPANRRPSSLSVLGRRGRFSLLSGNLSKKSLQGWGDSKDPLAHPQMHPALKAPVKDTGRKSEREALGFEERKLSL